MKTACASIYPLNEREKLEKIFIIFDDESHRTFITDRLRFLLGFKSIYLKIARFMERDGSSGDEKDSDCKVCLLVQVRLVGKNSENNSVNVYFVPAIFPLPDSISINICKDEFPHLSP